MIRPEALTRVKCQMVQRWRIKLLFAFIVEILATSHADKWTWVGVATAEYVGHDDDRNVQE